MNYITTEELLQRFQIKLERCGYMIDGPFALHDEPKCKYEGFAGIGPVFMNEYKMSWMDVWIGLKGEYYEEINAMLGQVCELLSLQKS